MFYQDGSGAGSDGGLGGVQDHSAQGGQPGAQGGADVFTAEQQAVLASQYGALAASYEAKIADMRTQHNEEMSRVLAAVTGSKQETFKADMQLGKPTPLKEDGSNWEEFSFKMKAHAGTMNEELSQKLDYLENHSGIAVTMVSLTAEEQKQSRHIYHALGMLVGGAATRILKNCLLYTSPSPRDKRQSRMPSSA